MGAGHNFYLTLSALKADGVISFFDCRCTMPDDFSRKAQQLISQGMKSATALSAEELQKEIAARFRYINYHRLSAFWGGCYKTNKVNGVCEKLNIFNPGTYWENIMAQYMFDRHLRQIFFDAISRIEVALRVRLAYHWQRTTGKETLAEVEFVGKEYLLSKVNEYYKPGKTELACHYLYHKGVTDAVNLPVDVLVEFTTFGNLSALLRAALADEAISGIAEQVACDMGMNGDVKFFCSGINLLNEIRNACAHQARVWNHRWLSKKKTPILCDSQRPEWEFVRNDTTGVWKKTGGDKTLCLRKDSTAAALTFCYVLLHAIAPQSQWKSRLMMLMTAPGNGLKKAYRNMGFNHEKWIEHPLWSNDI